MCVCRRPWRDATLSASGSTAASTPQRRVALGDGFHCSDLIVANADVDKTVAAVQKEALGAIGGWVGSFRGKREEGGGRRGYVQLWQGKTRSQRSLSLNG